MIVVYSMSWCYCCRFKLMLRCGNDCLSLSLCISSWMILDKICLCCLCLEWDLFLWAQGFASWSDVVKKLDRSRSLNTMLYPTGSKGRKHQPLCMPYDTHVLIFVQYGISLSHHIHCGNHHVTNKVTASLSSWMNEASCSWSSQESMIIPSCHLYSGGVGGDQILS